MAVTSSRIDPRAGAAGIPGAATVFDEMARRGARWLAFLARNAQAGQPVPEDESDQAETEAGVRDARR